MLFYCNLSGDIQESLNNAKKGHFLTKDTFLGDVWQPSFVRGTVLWELRKQFLNDVF